MMSSEALTIMPLAVPVWQERPRACTLTSAALKVS